MTNGYVQLTLDLFSLIRNWTSLYSSQLSMYYLLFEDATEFGAVEG